MNNRRKIISLIFVCGLFLLTLFFYRESTLTIMGNEITQGDERTTGEYYVFYDIDNNKAIDMMSRNVYKGDKLILDDNSLYEVKEIEGDKVFCKFLKKEKIIWAPKQSSALQLSENQNKTVGLYCTHTDESYQPTSGTSSKEGNGDVLKVANNISQILKSQGLNALFNDSKHDPHDANAYQRSRRTAAQILKNQPLAILDIHRDGVPDPKFYRTEIDGKSASQIRLVVGRQNQNRQANLEFAKQIKAYYDEKKPGLIKGIFIAKGNYNQDLGPRSILLECGTYTNSLEEVINGTSTFATLFPELLGVTKPIPAGKPSSGEFSSIALILLLVLLGGGIFLLVSTGSIEGSVNSMKNFTKEFTGFLNPLRSRRKK